MVRYPAITFAAVALLAVLAAPARGADAYEEGLAAYDDAAASRQPDHPGYAAAFAAWEAVEEAERKPALRYHLGMLYYHGIGGADFDQVRGIELIRGAADDGYPLAIAFLAFLHENGDGSLLLVSDAVALALYERAAAADNCAALKRLAHAYREGELGVAVDAGRAGGHAERVPGCTRR